MNAQASVPRSHRIAVALTAIAVFAVGMRGGGFDIPERHIVGIVAWLFVLASLPFVQRPVRPVVIVAGLLTTLTLFTGLSAFWSESAERSVYETTRVLSYLGLFLVGALLAQLVGRRPIVTGLTIGLGGLLLMAVLSRLEPGLFPEQELQQARPEVQARLTYPLNYWNGVALLAAMAIPFFLYQATRADLRPRIRALSVAALPVAGLALYLTFSRGGLAAALLAAVVFLAASPTRWAALAPLAMSSLATVPLVLFVRSERALNDGLLESDAARSHGHRVLVALIVVCAAVWALAPLLERIDIRSRLPRRPRMRTRAVVAAGGVGLVFLALAVVAFGDVDNRWESFRGASDTPANGQIERRYFSASGNGRYEYWSAAAEAWESRPIAGRGAGTWELWWQRHATIEAFVRDSHSLLFDTLAELGVIGLMLVLGVFAAIVWLAIQGRRRLSGADAALAACLLAAIAAFAVSASIDWVWEIPALAGTFFVIAGLAVGRGALPGRSNSTARRWTPGLGVGAAIALFAWVAICIQALPLLSNWQIRASQDAVNRRDFEEAKKHAESARSLQPWAASPKIQLALTLRATDQAGAHAALAPAREAVRDEPTNWRAWLVLANIENSIGDADAYARHLTIARSLNPRSRYWQSIGFSLPPEQLPR